MRRSHQFGIVSVLVFAISTIVLAHGWKAPEMEAKKTNPLKSSEAVIEAGQNLFLDLCSNCHGEGALGAEDADTDMTAPPNLVERINNHSDGDFLWKIKTGRNDMPPFEQELNEDEIWQIIRFIRALAEK